ncbi:MAG: SEL1-like repeat protein [Kiloniellaceae bacterium]
MRPALFTPFTLHLSALLTVCLLLGPLAGSPVWAAADAEAGQAAADTAAPPPPAEAAPGGSESPWEHPLWHNATTMMRVYLCDHARRPPSWCGEPRPLPGNVELPEPQGPPLHDEDAKWLAFLEQTDPGDLSSADVAVIRRRATERRDPQAMEILGFLYANGASVHRDYAESYRWYGLAFLAGETRVRANMDVVWQQLQRYDLEGALALTREFDALAAETVPDSLEPAVPPRPATAARLPAGVSAPETPVAGGQ